MNFTESDDPELESDGESKNSFLGVNKMESSSESMEDLKKKRQDLFAFAAYVPPGKHLLLLRDSNTQRY